MTIQFIVEIASIIFEGRANCCCFNLTYDQGYSQQKGNGHDGGICPQKILVEKFIPSVFSGDQFKRKLFLCEEQIDVCHHTSYIMLREDRNLALILFQAIDGITSKTSPYLEDQQARDDFERKIKGALEEPNHAGREGISSEPWLEVHIDEGGEIVSANEVRPWMDGRFQYVPEMLFSFYDTYCNIL